MNMQWKKVLIKIVVYLVTEVTLSLIGINDLASYSEFVSAKGIESISVLPANFV